MATDSVGTWSKEAQAQYRKVSPANKETFRKEKMVQELRKNGFNKAAISGMTGMSEGSVVSMMKKTGKNIHLDGKY